MSNKQLYSDIFRPVEEGQLIGKTQKRHIKQLQKSIEKNAPIRKVLFVGRSGTGKTTLSEMYIRYLLDLKTDDDPRHHISGYVNCASETGIDNVRANVIGNFPYKTLGEEYRIYFLDELHGLSKSAQNALLTPIEHIPPHVVVLAATTEKNKIIETLQSRFFICELKPPTRQEYFELAGWLGKKFNKELRKSEIDEIINRSGSNIRYFINFIQQLIEGSYSTAQEEHEKDNLIRVLLFTPENDFSKIFQLTAIEGDFNGVCVRISRAAMTTIRNGKVRGTMFSNVMAALDIFGEGLSPYMDVEVSFHRLLLNYLMVKK